LGERELLILVFPCFDPESDPIQEVSRERDDAGDMIESTDCRFQLAEGASSPSDNTSQVASPGLELVGRQDHEERPSVQVLTEDCLNFRWSPLGN
jgi:hypothetical protein